MMIGNIILGVDIGSLSEVFMNAICCYSNSLSIPSGFSVSVLGMD